MSGEIVLRTLALTCLVALALTVPNAAAQTQPETKPATLPAATQPQVTQLLIEDIQLGEGMEAAEGSWLVVNYTGKLLNGEQFDSSHDPGRQPFELFLPGQVISGWNQGLIGIRKGGVRKVTIPWKLAYGEAGRSPTIPPKATLVFVIECLDVLPGGAVNLPSGLEIATTKAGEGEPGGIGSWYTYHMRATNAEDGKILGDTRAMVKGEPAMTAVPSGRLDIPNLDGLVYGCRAGETRRMTFKGPKGVVWIDLECLNVQHGKSIELANGLKIEDVQIGDGPWLMFGHAVSVRYTGMLADGTVFDGNANGDKPPFETQIPNKNLIQGWNIGLLGMKVGGHRKLTIPGPLAYGDHPPPGTPIKPGDTLIFEITLLDVK